MTVIAIDDDVLCSAAECNDNDNDLLTKWIESDTNIWVDEMILTKMSEAI